MEINFTILKDVSFFKRNRNIITTMIISKGFNFYKKLLPIVGKEVTPEWPPGLFVINDFKKNPLFEYLFLLTHSKFHFVIDHSLYLEI